MICRSAARGTRRRRARRAGYTLIEVMMAIAIITASSVALVALQEIVIRGNMDARQTTTATTIARTTIELLRLDALYWTQSYPSAGSVMWGTGARGFLRDAPTAASASANAWNRFGATAVAVEHAYDYQGNVTNTNADMFYCVESRYAWVYPGQALRADIRVWWVRTGQLINAAAYAGCPLQGANLNIVDLHSLQATTVLRYTPAGVP
jgi:prepilin-type N-terminal cleavage/methylation domain-containing protein